MKNIEIPQPNERDHVYRFFEMIPAILSWGAFALLIILSIFSPEITSFIVIGYILLWFIKAVGINIRGFQGYRMLQKHMKIDWNKLIDDLDNPKTALQNYSDNDQIESWHRANLNRQLISKKKLKSSDVVQVLMVALYKESYEIIQPTIASIIDSEFDMQQVILLIAYEERGGQETEKTVSKLIRRYGDKFLYAEGIKHPDGLEGEVRGKGGNITYAGYELVKILEKLNIAQNRAVVTTLDCDNRPHPKYLSALTYAFMACPSPVNTSFQPIPMFLNNIWDVPAPMRVIATGNSFWNILISLRPHMLRNFSSHAQGMESLVGTDFWSVRTIVEDGHQYWRTYFRYDGHHDVYPIFIPIYQDAVLSNTYIKTLKAQFIQIRRWAWGASDLAYVLQKGFREKNKIPKLSLFFKTLRQIEMHFSWATAPILLMIAPIGPLYLNQHSRDNILLVQLPQISSQIQTIAMVGILMTVYLSFKMLPPRPTRYKKHRTIFMVLQWVYMPVTSLVYSASAALYSQTRLALGKYLGSFDLTEKSIKK